jgi:hypothetical protein
MNNHFQARVLRLPPMSGVLRYDRDTVIDVKQEIAMAEAQAQAEAAARAKAEAQAAAAAAAEVPEPVEAAQADSEVTPEA